MAKPDFGCGLPDCGASTTIADTPSFGWGQLDDWGFWEYGCHECARAFEKAHPELGPCWPFKVPKLEEAKC